MAIKRKIEDLNEMHIRFANPRLKEFIEGECLLENPKTINSKNQDYRTILGEYIAYKKFSLAHVSYLKIEQGLHAEHVKKEDFSVHYDTTILHLIAWLNHAMLIRLIKEESSGKNRSLQEGSPCADSLTVCFQFSSMTSQFLMRELMASGDESDTYREIDSEIAIKVDRAFLSNQHQFSDALKKGKDCKVIAVASILLANQYFNKEALRFSIDRWDLNSHELSMLSNKMNSTLPTDIQKKAVGVLLREINDLDTKIENIFQKILIQHQHYFE